MVSITNNCYCEKMHKNKKIRSSKEIGRRIKELRKSLGISQEALAERMDITYQQVQKYENGTNKLNVENIQLIAQILSVPISFFFGSDEHLLDNPFFNLSTDELNLLRLFRQTNNTSHKNLLVQIASITSQI